VKRQHGPMPEQFYATIDCLVRAGKIAQKKGTHFVRAAPVLGSNGARSGALVERCRGLPCPLHARGLRQVHRPLISDVTHNASLPATSTRKSSPLVISTGSRRGPPGRWLHVQDAFLVALAHGLSGSTTLRSATCSFSDARVKDLTSSAESKARLMSSRATARKNLRRASACSRWRRNMIECCSILRSSHKFRRHFRQLQQLHQLIIGLGALAA
jgi:hypothetical protein